MDIDCAVVRRKVKPTALYPLCEQIPVFDCLPFVLLLLLLLLILISQHCCCESRVIVIVVSIIYKGPFRQPSLLSLLNVSENFNLWFFQL